MCQRPPISTPTATLFPCTPLFLSSRPRLAVRGRRCLRQLDHEAGAATLAILVPEVATGIGDNLFGQRQAEAAGNRSEEHTSELQSLMRISYAVFCLTKNTTEDMRTRVPTHTTRHNSRARPHD